MAISITKPTIGGNENTWGSVLDTALDVIVDAVNGTSGTVAPNLSTLTIGGTNVTSTAAELNKLDGFSGTFEDLNYAKDLRATGVTTTEFDKLDGLTATTAELNKLDGVTATTAELNYVDGVSSNIQTQLNAKQATISGGASTIASSNLTANRALISNGSGKVEASSTITTTELGYLNGVSSNIQTQFNNIATANDATITISGGQGMHVNSNASSESFTLNQSSNETISVDLASNQRFVNSVTVNVGNDHEYITFNPLSSGQLNFYTGASEEMRLTSGGDLHVDGDVIGYSTTISDQRLKSNINKIDGALDKMAQISGYTFTYNENGKDGAGVIAQEVEKVLPSAVESKTLAFHGQEGIEYKTVNYDQIIGLLVEAIKELKAEVQELKIGSPI